MSLLWVGTVYIFMAVWVFLDLTQVDLKCFIWFSAPLPPCDSNPCGNLTCIDLTENATVWDQAIWEAEYNNLLDLYGLDQLDLIENESSVQDGYMCVTPCQLSPCSSNFQCIDLMDFGSSENSWINYLETAYQMDPIDEFALDIGYQVMLSKSPLSYTQYRCKWF